MQRTVYTGGQILVLIDRIPRQELLLLFDEIVVVGDELLSQDNARSSFHGVGYCAEIGHGAGVAQPGANTVCQR